MHDNQSLKSGPKDVFLQLFNIVTFYLTVIGFITLYIQYINAIFPDALNYYFSGIANTVRVASSILVISVPAFLLSAWLLAKDTLAAPEKREFKLHKWLLYFTLFVSAITIIIDLITFVYNFLSGELTARFFLKILVVLLIAVAVFGYYMWELKRTNLQSRWPRILGIALLALMLVSIVGGFFIVGTPAKQRDLRFDEQRIGDLQMIQGQIVNNWMQKGKLPAKLEDLQDSISGFSVPKDPQSAMSYEYMVVDKNNFQLCATFKVASSDIYHATQPAVRFGDLYSDNWNHSAGLVCFDRKIDPELYKPQTAKPLPVITK